MVYKLYRPDSIWSSSLFHLSFSAQTGTHEEWPRECRTAPLREPDALGNIPRMNIALQRISHTVTTPKPKQYRNRIPKHVLASACRRETSCRISAWKSGTSGTGGGPEKSGLSQCVSVCLLRTGTHQVRGRAPQWSTAPCSRMLSAPPAAKPREEHNILTDEVHDAFMILS